MKAKRPKPSEAVRDSWIENTQAMQRNNGVEVDTTEKLLAEWDVMDDRSRMAQASSAATHMTIVRAASGKTHQS